MFLQTPSYVTRLAQATPGHPRIAILGVDYGWDTLDDREIKQINRLLIHHWQRGGMVTVSTHVGNPFRDEGDVQDKAGVDLVELLNPQSTAHARWLRQLDTLATGLAELRDAGVAVLWRPFHEMNGGWFWWCPDTYKGQGWAPREDFTALWKHMFDYFTHTKGLNNLLWVYSANAQLNEKMRPTDYYYPGTEMVDVVGFDLYRSPLDAEAFDINGSYSRLAALGKPFGLTEFGPTQRDGTFDNLTLMEGIRQHCPQTTFFVYWHSRTNNRILYRKLQCQAIIDHQNGPALLADPWVVTRDEIGK